MSIFSDITSRLEVFPDSHFQFRHKECENLNLSRSSTGEIKQYLSSLYTQVLLIKVKSSNRGNITIIVRALSQNE